MYYLAPRSSVGDIAYYRRYLSRAHDVYMLELTESSFASGNPLSSGAHFTNIDYEGLEYE